jgi:hypothetical protein
MERRGVDGGRRRLALIVIAFALAGVLASIVSAAASSGRPDTALASADQSLKKAFWWPPTPNGPPPGVSQFPFFKDLGVGIYQVQVRWDAVAAAGRPNQPTDPNDLAYNWPNGLEQTIDEAANNGIKTSIMVLGTPPWANGGRSWKWAPDNAADFGDFAAAVARRYPNVHLWMIWGEPNRQPNFGPFTPAPPTGPLNHRQARAPRKYAQLLDAAYGGLKSIDPSNLVIGGNTFTAAGPGSIHTYQWIRYMRLPGGKRPRMDMYGHNPFGFRKPKLHARASPRGQVDFSDLRRLAHKLDRAFPGPPLKLYLSEWGVPTDTKDLELGFSVSRAKQAQWIRAAYRIVRGWGRIYTLGWIHPYDVPEQKGTQGLLDAQGNPKPGYYAFKAG